MEEFKLMAAGLNGHWHQTLELPCGYQHFDWLGRENPNSHGVYLNDVESLRKELSRCQTSHLHLYTQHEIFFDKVLKHTRTSPNWEGGLVTYSTCKHNLRTYDKSLHGSQGSQGSQGWPGVWLSGLCPKQETNNCVLFVGVIDKVFAGNYDLSRYVLNLNPSIHKVKSADTNPRGDLYTPFGELSEEDGEVFDHHFFNPPFKHTRSVELYKKSPGSVSTRQDGKIPKWWRDLEYIQHGRRPPSFILSPCWIFNKPLLYTSHYPGRAVLKLTTGRLLESLTVME